MKDEEYIEMETKTGRYKERKPIYALRKEDFIPITGLKKFHERQKAEYFPLKNCSPTLFGLKDKFLDKEDLKEVVLILYNTAVVGGTIMGLAKLLVK